MYINNDALQPDKLEEILALRPEGADVEPKKVDDLYGRMKGAIIGRFAGCVLGIPVEMYSVARMQAVALESGTHCLWILYQLSHQRNPRILEWVALPYSRGSSQPRDRTQVSCIACGFFTS